MSAAETEPERGPELVIQTPDALLAEHIRSVEDLSELAASFDDLARRLSGLADQMRAQAASIETHDALSEADRTLVQRVLVDRRDPAGRAMSIETMIARRRRLDAALAAAPDEEADR